MILTKSLTSLTLAVTLALPGAAAMAQQADDNYGLTFSMDATLDCLDNSETAPERSECVGRSADACMDDTPGGYSTVAMGGCISLEARYWDDRLNSSYQSARANAKTYDADKPEYAPAMGDSLRDMQRAWIGFRDATCSYEAAQWGGGTGAGPASAGCFLRMTAEQAMYIEYSGVGG